MVRAVVAVILLGVWLGMLALPASADEPDPAAYEELVAAALSAQSAGDFARSHELFQQAFTEYSNARALRGMGVSAYQAGLFAASVRALRAALVHPEKPLDEELKKAVLDLLSRAEAEVATFRFSLQPVDPQIRVKDDPTAQLVLGELALMPGPHTLLFEAEGHEPYSLEVLAQRGARETLRVVMVKTSVIPPVIPSERPAEPATPAAPLTVEPAQVRSAHAWRKPALWVLGATSAAAAAAGLGVWLLASQRHDEIASDCRKLPAEKCSVEEGRQAWKRENITQLNRTLLAAEITAGALAASTLLLGATLWLRPIGERRVEVSLAPTGVSVRGQF